MTKQERLELQKKKLIEMQAHEKELHDDGKKFIAGIDEVGRGPLAGPVYAAAVVLPDDFSVLGINDSKKLSEKKRIELDAIIREQAIAYGIGIADNREIDEINILNATKKAMLKAIDIVNAKLKESGESEGLDCILIDAVKLDTEIPQESIIKGDEKSLSIAAASIVAKVARDSYMQEMEELYPGYDFASNKGYGTAAHYEGLRSFGITPIHRRSFLKKFEESEMAKNKFYAVKNGRRIGIFNTWDECKESVNGFSGAIYKSFVNKADAEAFIGIDSSGATANNSTNTSEQDGDYRIRAFVDGSYDVASGDFSGGAVIVKGDEILAELSEACRGRDESQLRNVAGEIMGARLAIDFCIESGFDSVSIYHDYEGVGKWGDDLWKANLDMTKAYKAYIAEARKKIDISFVKVKAHAGNRYNEMADGLAKKALEKQ